MFGSDFIDALLPPPPSTQLFPLIFIYLEMVIIFTHLEKIEILENT